MIKDGIISDLTLYTNIKEESINNKNIIVLDILNTPDKPYYLKDKVLKSNGVYLRSSNAIIPTSDKVIKNDCR